MAVVHNAQQREHQIQNNDLQEPLSPKANEDPDVSSPMDHSPPRSRYDKLTFYVILAHHGQIDLNKKQLTAQGTQQTTKWTPLGSQITES